MKFFTPVPRRPGMIDLTHYGALEQHEQAILRTKALDLATMMSDERGDAVQLSGAPEVKSPPIPQFYPETRPRRSLWKVILSECHSLIKI